MSEQRRAPCGPHCAGCHGGWHDTSSRAFELGDFRLVDARFASLRTRPHSHDTAYFGLTLSGSYEEQYGPRTFVFKEHTIAFDPGDTKHRTTATDLHIMRLEIPQALWESVRDVEPVLNEPFCFTSPSVVSIARRLYGEARSVTVADRLIAQGLAYELVGYALRGRTSRRGRGVPAWLQSVRERLSCEFLQAPALRIVAQDAGVHPVHLARSFAAHYGCSPGEYVRTLKVEEAMRRLQRSDEPLCDIAIACGFSDQSHFSTVFRRVAGVSPGAYRRSFRQ